VFVKLAVVVCPKGRVNGRPTKRWIVICVQCRRIYLDHPYQKLLDEAAAKPAPQPTAPVSLQNRYMSVVEAEAEQQTVQQLSRTVQDFEQRLASLEAKLDALLASRKK
jgi:hypothetical protein